ncbi:probable palmitoyltransferase ZDHHC24 [Drosophila ficusphila]|uniref:probable palmitoyltransferase ZDHHC24 n=1 Tax=Drosophila ficusphila TaxID=30025 RepID=UPI0007E608AF|nr:probable palmitoyltransferase ZDHHC24 [Drosophila ficusphila]
MILRSWDRVKPRSLSDFACFLLVAIFVPVTYIFQVTVVMPELFAIGGVCYTVLWLASLFLIFNITSNMLACMLVDTSIRMELLKPPVESGKLARWHMCHDCQTLVPPRSWHCEVCNVCILKRDHHCRFTCCCIGHHNYRYFFYYLVYMIIGSLAAAIMESIYLWCLHPDIYWRWSTLFTIFAPVVSLTFYPSWETFYLVIYDLTLLGFCISSLLLVFHWAIVKSGSVTRERGTRKFDRGLRGNLEMVLGTRMHLTWLSPFLRSDLPHDGVNWEPNAVSSLKEE